MTHISPTIPVVGQPNSTEEPRIVTALTQLVAAVNTGDDQQVGTDGVWRTVMADVNANTANSGVVNFLANGSVGVSAAAGALIPRLLIPNAADVAVTGRTTKLRVQATIMASAAPSGTTITFGLYPVTAIGGTGGNVSYTLGTVVSGSAVVTAISTSAGARAASTGFDLSGLSGSSAYVLGFAVPSTVFGVHMYAELQMRHV